MRPPERREALRRMIEAADGPVTAAALAKRLGVSRQQIVGDVALLRAERHGILSTPRGYVSVDTQPKGLSRRVVCRHSGGEMEAELNAMVDCGCTVEDVIVDHPVYGQLSGILRISNREDVRHFLRRCRMSNARPLCELTEGIHLHTLTCADEEGFQNMCRKLRDLGILLE